MPAFASSLDSAQSVVNTQVNFEDHAVESQKQIGAEGRGEGASNQSWSRRSCPYLTPHCLGSILSYRGDLTCQKRERSF